MKARSLADVKARLSEYVAACRDEPVLITKKGRPAALLLAVDENADLEDIVLLGSPRFQDFLRRTEDQIRAGQLIPHDEFWRRVEQQAAEREGSSATAEEAGLEGEAAKKAGRRRRKRATSRTVRPG